MGKTRVLLVDDEQSFTNLLKLNLEDTGNYEVKVENWPEDAQAARLASRARKVQRIQLDGRFPEL